MNSAIKGCTVAVASLVVLVLCTLVAGLGAVGSAGWLVGRVVERDPQRVLDVAAGIAAYEVPEGFGEPMAARLLGFSLVGYEGADGRSHIYFLQVPRALRLDRAALETQVGQVGARDLQTRLEVVEERPCTIGEEETTLIVSEELSGDDVPYRSASALFAGRGGTALVNVSMPAASWDQAAVEAWLASVQ